jgi:hypothetical protein
MPQRLYFVLPEGGWQFYNFSQNPATGGKLYEYIGPAAEDSEGRMIVPVIGVIITPVAEGTTLAQYSQFVRKGLGHTVLSRYPGVANGLGNALAYKAEYTDGAGLHRKIVVAHAVRQGKGIQVIMDTSSELFPKYEDAFVATLSSMKFLSEDELNTIGE